MQGNTIVLQLEPDALGKRHRGAVINGIGLPAHITFPGIRARLPAAAGFFFTAERPADFGAGGADIDVGYTAVRTHCRDEKLGLPDILGKD